MNLVEEKRWTEVSIELASAHLFLYFSTSSITHQGSCAFDLNVAILRNMSKFYDEIFLSTVMIVLQLM